MGYGPRAGASCLREPSGCGRGWQPETANFNSTLVPRCYSNNNGQGSQYSASSYSSNDYLLRPLLTSHFPLCPRDGPEMSGLACIPTLHLPSTCCTGFLAGLQAFITGFYWSLLAGAPVGCSCDSFYPSLSPFYRTPSFIIDSSSLHLQHSPSMT